MSKLSARRACGKEKKMTRKISTGIANTGTNNIGKLSVANSNLVSPPTDVDIVFTPNGTGVTAIDGDLVVTAGENASSTSTGSVIISGGLGISGNLNVAGFSSGVDGVLIGIDPATPSTANLTNFTSTGLLTLEELIEAGNAKSGASGTVTHDFTEGNTWIHTSLGANFTVNLTNVPTTNNRIINISLILVQSGTARYANGFQVDGVTQTVQWIGGSYPTPRANQLEVQTFTLIRVGSSWTVEASLTSHGTLPNGSSSAQAATSVANVGVYNNTSGTYWIRTASMASAQQYYVDFSTGYGPWARIFLANTDNYNTTSFSWDNGQTSNLLRDLTPTFMYCFVDTANNSTITPWQFRLVGDQSSGNWVSFRDTPPMGHGGTGSPLITQVNTVRISTGEEYRSYLRTGVSSFGNQCDDGRSGIWGQICLKAGNTSNTGTGGYSDFPQFSSFAVSNADNWAQSNQAYSTNTVSSARRFAVYVK